MATETEIERKWVITKPQLDNTSISHIFDEITGIEIVQGYVANNVRVRLSPIMGAELTIKIQHTDLSLREFNYQISSEEADEILESTELITKHRYALLDGYTIDIFCNELEGLILVEKEFDSEELAKAEVTPEWLSDGIEVTNDLSYRNANLGGKNFIAGIGIINENNLVTGDQDEIEITPLIIP